MIRQNTPLLILLALLAASFFAVLQMGFAGNAVGGLVDQHMTRLDGRPYCHE